MIEITSKIKNIQDVNTSDVVLSFNKDDRRKEWQPVTELHRPVVEQEDQVYISFENGGTVVTSTKHPMLFMGSSGLWEYKPSGDLSIGDVCKTEQGSTRVDGITIGYNEDEQFYDITVDGNNNFFAGDDFETATVIHNSATVYYPLWHLEVGDLLVLKNNKGTDETRIRHMDYGVQLNRFMYQRLLDNKNITLFNPHDVPDLYDAFFVDQAKFAELYDKYERSTKIKKTTIPALELFSTLILERNNTGRIYIQNVDHSNSHSSFLDTSPVRMSNLCVEITLPTSPLTNNSRIPYLEKFTSELSDISAKDFRDEYGEIALCTLMSVNWGAIKTLKDFEKCTSLAVRALDELLDYQDYPVIAAGIPATKRRSLGVGVSNLAYFIAKNGGKYSDGSANDIIAEYAEAMSYYLISASMELAKEKGPCDWFDETKYSQGIFPIDTCKPAVEDIIPSHKDNKNFSWNDLRKDVKQNGMRNSTLMALMPVETSSQIINATNGIEPPRSVVSVKGSKDGALKQVVPESHHLKNKYEYLWDMPNCVGYMEVAAILQKYVDQSISTNTSYNPANYDGNKVPMSVLMSDLTTAYRLGIKTLYYQNTHDQSGEVDLTKDEVCPSCIL